MPEDRALDYECPDCGNALRLDDSSVYCEECETDFPEILARLDGETAERVRLLPLLERAEAAMGHILTAWERHLPARNVHGPTQILSTARAAHADLRRELGLPEEG